MAVIITFLQNAIRQGICILFGANGEILTEKSGNLNLGVPGMMYMGGIAGLAAAFMYERAVGTPNAVVGMVLALVAALAAGALGGLVFSVLTISLRANQNVTGLALTTFGVGLGNFFGGSLSKLAGGVGQISTAVTASAFRNKLPFLSGIPVVGEALFSYGMLTYLAIVVSIALSLYLNRTRQGLCLRAVGENPATADAVGINVTRYKYVATCVGSGIAGLGGFYYIIDYMASQEAYLSIEAFGWLSIALVIFALWRPPVTIIGSTVFGILFSCSSFITHFDWINVTMATKPLLKMLPYVVTIIVLIISSIRNKKENQPPASLGLSYFREER